MDIIGDKQEKNKSIWLGILFFFSFLSVSWMLSSRNSFTFDDFSTIVNGRFYTFTSIFRFLPQQTYNDRCLGIMFVKALNMLFGMNYQMYHMVFVLIHLCNVFLVFKVFYLLFLGKEESERFFSGIIIAAIFGIYPITLMAVQWVAAVYDLLCCFFYLNCMLSYLKYRHNEKNKVYYACMTIFYFYLGLRTKEMALILPALFMVYELYQSYQAKKLRFSKLTIVSTILMICYALLLFTGKEIVDMSKSNPYYQSFNIISLFVTAIKYLFVYFDYGNTAFAFYRFSYGAIFGVILFSAIFFFAIYTLIKKKDIKLIMSIIAIGISLSVVLTMPNMQHRLYLYIPSIFVALTITVFINEIRHLIKKFDYRPLFICVVLFCYFVNYTPGMLGFKNVWLSYCQQDANDLKNLETIQKPVEGTNVYVKGASEGYNIFFYGPGHAMKYLFDDNSLNIELVDEFPENPKTPYMCLNYSPYSIELVKRDDSAKEIIIEGIYPSEMREENGQKVVDFAVVCDEYTPDMKIYINDQEMQTVVGSDFISTTVVIENDVNELNVCVKDVTLNYISKEKSIEFTQ